MKIIFITQKVQDTVIHLEVDGEQWEITQGSKRQAERTCSSTSMPSILTVQSYSFSTINIMLPVYFKVVLFGLATNALNVRNNNNNFNNFTSSGV